MKMQVIIEFDVKEIEANGVDESALERLKDMTPDRVCMLMELGFMNVFGQHDIEQAMFDGEDHLLAIDVTEIKCTAVVEYGNNEQPTRNKYDD